jgi:hypothetical protein
MHGKGKLITREGHEYKGYVKHGVISGKGVMNWSNNVTYKGEFEHN